MRLLVTTFAVILSATVPAQAQTGGEKLPDFENAEAARAYLNTLRQMVDKGDGSLAGTRVRLVQNDNTAAHRIRPMSSFTNFAATRAVRSRRRQHRLEHVEIERHI